MKIFISHSFRDNWVVKKISKATVTSVSDVQSVSLDIDDGEFWWAFEWLSEVGKSNNNSDYF